jgi:hypothetical protein
MKTRSTDKRRKRKMKNEKRSSREKKRIGLPKKRGHFKKGLESNVERSEKGSYNLIRVPVWAFYQFKSR